jgi:transcriptional regulator with XRE-family HTH domain
MTILARDIYAEALRGEPLERAVFPPALNTHSSMWTLGDWVIVLPTPDLHPAPAMQQVVRQLRQWTGWSTRRLAEVLHTSHTTIRAVESGRPLVGGHSGDLRRRLTEAHDVVERVFLVADRNAEQVATILDSAPAGRRSAVEELKWGDPARAYLTAVDVLRPRRQGLIVGDRPRRGGATEALHE